MIRNFFIFFLVLGLLSSCQKQSSKEKDVIQYETSKDFQLGGSPVTVNIKISKKEISLIDSLYLKVVVFSSEGVVTLPPLLTESFFEGWALLKQPQLSKQIVQRKGVDVLSLVSLYELEAKFSGKAKLEKMIIPFRLEKEKPQKKGKEWKTYKIETDAFEINVLPVQLDPNEKISGIQGYRRGDIDWTPISISFLIILVMLAAFFIWDKRYKKEKIIDPYLVKQKAFQSILEKLEEVEKQDFSQYNIRELHTDLSNILRDYLENIFDQKALGQTSEEFIQDIYRKNLFNGDQQKFLKNFSNLSDLVKFASFEPDSKHNQEVFETIKKFVESSAESYFSQYDRI